MRILRARVGGYGPLRSAELELAPGLNVVYGPNEAGKTTLLDFLLAHLFRWEKRRGTRLATVLDGVDRFGDVGDASGEVVLRLADRTWSYPGDGPSLLHHLKLEHAGLAGLFCVRSGELELPEKEEGDFWRELKKVLSGLPEGVESLRRRAHGEGGLTPTGEMLSDRGSPGLRTRHAELEERIATLVGLADELDEVADLASDIADAERRLEALERARTARIASLYGELEDAREELEELPEVDEERIRTWAEAVEEAERRERAAEEERTALEEAREAEAEAGAARDDLASKAAPLRERLERARAADLEERARRAAAAGEAEAGPLEDALYWAGLVLLMLAIGGAFFTPSETLRRPAWIGVLLAALAGGGVLYWVGRRMRRGAAERTAERGEVLEAAADCGLETLGVEAVPDAVDALEERLHDVERELEGARERAKAAEQRRRERERALRREEEGRREALEAAEAAREELGLEELERARELLEERRRLTDRAEKVRTALQELAGMDETAWARAEAPVADDLPEWNPGAKRELTRELEDLRREHDERSRAYTRVGLERPEDVLTELQEAREELAGIDLDSEAGRLAGEIFGTMGEALDDRLDGALGREGPHAVGGLVERVTDRYVTVERTGGDGLGARDREGVLHPLARLSRGTRDQVYLALRVGLARSALEAAELGEPGFFLLDDAFLTADWERRERLVEAAAGLAEEGWQVVYLTCDDHLRGLFEEAGARLHLL